MNSISMTHYRFLGFIVVVLYGIGTCNSASMTREGLPGLQKEVEDNSRYKTLEANATLMKLLVSDKNGVTRTEVFDMLHSRDDNVELPSFSEDEEDSRADVPLPPEPKQQAELLQGPDEIVYHDSAAKAVAETRAAADAEAEAGAEWQGSRSAAALLMVVVVCAIVMLAYGALIVWRRIYLQRNGLKHEQLRNEPNVEETIDM